MSLDTEAIDKLFLELSQFTNAMTARELELIERIRKLEQRHPAPVPVAWCRADEFENAMKKGGSFNGWKDPGAGPNRCDMRLYALPSPSGDPAPQTRLATHPDGTPMASIGEAADLGTIARLLKQCQPAPVAAAAEGEVGELVARLRRASDGASAMGWEGDSWMMARAADLLERQPAPVPVAVSERPWEREGWCDEEGRCWWGRAADKYCNHDWHYATRAEVEDFCSDAMPQVVLPAIALPLPAGEVQP